MKFQLLILMIEHLLITNVTDEHIKRDISDNFLKDKVGTTRTGTGPANSVGIKKDSYC